MICRIDEFGRLEITVSNSTELFAMQEWAKSADLADNQVMIKMKKDEN